MKISLEEIYVLRITVPIDYFMSRIMKKIKRMLEVTMFFNNLIINVKMAIDTIMTDLYSFKM